MKNLIILLKRFIPPYRGKVALNIIYNILGAVFGAFSFVAFGPVLGILFGTQELVTEYIPFDWSELQASLTHGLSYFFSSIVIEYGESSALLLIGGIMVCGTLLKVGFTYLATVYIIHIRNGVVKDLRDDIFSKVLTLPVGFYSEERKGDIISRITGDVVMIETSVMNSLEMLIKNPIIISVMLGAMIAMSWQLTVFVFILLPIVGGVIGRIGKGLKKPSLEGQNKMGDLLSIIEESLGGLRVIKSFNAESKVDSKFNEQTSNYQSIMNRVMFRTSLAHPVSELLGTIVIVIILWYGGSLILDESSPLTPQNFIVYIAFFYSIINPAKAFSTALFNIQKGIAAMDRIDMILGAENKIKDGEKDILSFEDKIEFKNVTFKYVKDDVLKDINISIKKGSVVALVGTSGSGKSTFVDLVGRFWDVDRGQISIDGVDIRDLKIESLRNLIGNVNQEPILFNDTFFNNITFGVEDATMEQVIDAAKVANAHTFISETEDGYHSSIGDRGGKLSGGQRQRVSIARAVLKNPPIMILDEATSALDTESEVMVQTALENLMSNRTSIVIAHRLSTIVNADMICVFDKGEIVEVGTHQQLLDSKGIYYKLHSMQLK